MAGSVVEARRILAERERIEHSSTRKRADNGFEDRGSHQACITLRTKFAPIREAYYQGRLRVNFETKAKSSEEAAKVEEMLKEHGEHGEVADRSGLYRQYTGSTQAVHSPLLLPVNCL